jgi:hypothetical protein
MSISAGDATEPLSYLGRFRDHGQGLIQNKASRYMLRHLHEPQASQASGHLAMSRNLPNCVAMQDGQPKAVDNAILKI